MKKEIALILVSFFLVYTGCSSGDADIRPDTLPPVDTKDIETQLEEFGVYPSDVENINRLTCLADSISYKIATGRKNNNAWISIFNPAGKETFSFELDINNPQFPHREYDGRSIKLINKEIICLVGWITNIDPLDFGDNRAGYTIFSAVNLSTGKEVSRLTSEQNKYIFNDFLLSKETESYLILEQSNGNLYSFLHMIDTDGKLLWSRETDSSTPDYNERNDGMYIYTPYAFLNSEKMIFGSSDPAYDGFRIIDLKNHTLITTIQPSDIPFNGERFGEDKISYIWDNQPTIENKEIQLSYYERYIEKMQDEITGGIYYSIDTVGVYQYTFDINSYKYLQHTKIR